MSDCLYDSFNHGLNQSDVQNQRQQSNRNREELIDDLADCLAQSEDDFDMEQIDRILDKIEQSGGITSDFDAVQSLNQFHQKYGTSFSATPLIGAVKKPRHRKTLLYVARVAIIAAFLITFIGIAQATGLHIMDIFPWWNDSVFHFQKQSSSSSLSPETPPEIEYDSLQTALEKWDVQIPLAPTRLPDGAELIDLSVSEKEEQLMFGAVYDTPNGELFITFRQAAPIPFSDVEKNEESVEIYTAGGIDHQIITDVRTQKAVWHNGPWEGKITGNVSKEELIAMIDSIY